MRDNVNGGALTEVTFLVLLSVYTPRHGYGMMQFISEKTGGRVELGAGTLYGAINNLCGKGWIKPISETRTGKKEYIVTSEGRAAAEKELMRLEATARLAREVVGTDAVKDC